MVHEMNARRIWELCIECAGAIYGTTAPTSGYALRTARLLFGTCAQESGLVWERQRAVEFAGRRGGFSKWQVEEGSIQASLEYLRRRPAVQLRATSWLFADPHAGPEWLSIGVEALEWAMRIHDSDVIGVLFARLHYLWVTPEPIPEGVEAQAGYWKRFYNTAAGSGTVEEYLGNWERAVELTRKLAGFTAAGL
jgi:hypothetical protein